MKVKRTATIKIKCIDDESPESPVDLKVKVEFSPPLDRETDSCVAAITTELLHALEELREPNGERAPDEEEESQMQANSETAKTKS